jgi:hypothetical protein
MPTLAMPDKTRVFISFDYDHDDDLRVLLLGQAKHQDTPFSFEDWSIKQASADWKDKARNRIRSSAVVIVICGHHTKSAVGVATEIQIARDEGVPFWLLRGRKGGTCQWPKGTSWFWDTMHDWKWKNIESMCRAKTTPWWKRIW